ncbi:MAG: apolipoprotein N-acyltransferase, partial [Spirochaetaceae bacterium]
FLGYPWGLISYPVNTILPLVQFAEFTGVWGISFIMAFYNTLVAEFLHIRFSPNRLDPVLRFMPCFGDTPLKRLKTQFVFAFVILAIMFSYGTVRLIAGFPAKDSVTALLVQQNAYPWGEDRAEESLYTAARLTEEGLQSARLINKRVELIVWNETALKYPVRVFEEYPFRSSYPYRQMIPGLFEKYGAYVITGAPAMSAEKKYYNAALMVTPDGRVAQYYAKQHPVPFVEHIPLYDIPFMRTFFNKVIGIYQSWTMGNTTSLLSLPRENKPAIKIGVPICFEDVFADLCAGFVRDDADILVNITNDSWSQTNSALTQHLAAARFRAVENRRTLVRGTNAGLTCIIDASGAITDSTEMFEERAIIVDVPVYKEAMPTLYTLFPDAFPWLLIILLSLTVLFDFLHITWNGFFSRFLQILSGKKHGNK